MEIIYKPVSGIAPYEKNAKLHPEEQIESIANSIREFGFRQPLVVDTDNVIIVGHGRLLAAKRLGLDKVPCILAHDLTPEQIRAYRLADNKTNESEWDMDMLEFELGEILDFDMGGFGFDMSIGDEQSDTQEDNFSMDTSADPVTELGDIWQLGKHRLMCGDGTLAEDVRLLMNKKKADMVFTDPPYGVNVKGGKNKSNIAGDLTQVAIPFAFELAVTMATKDKARYYFCGGEGNMLLYHKLFEKFLFQMPKIIVWTKNGFVIKQNGYHNAFELVYYGFKTGGGGKEHWYGGRTEAEASDVWKISRDANVNYLHPTQKPVELPARAIKNSSPKGAIVFDPFGGSGSTLIACEQLDRVCYMMEINPKYCDVIILRWETLTGLKAELIKSS